MIIDFETNSLPDHKVFDVCIVGAGAAGLTIAHQMLQKGYSVLLLEGGGSSRWERKSQALNKSYLHGRAFAGSHSGRFRALGGTTSAWAGQVKELDDIDFQHRDWIAGSSWPIGKAELQKFYEQARELDGSAAHLHDDSEIWERAEVQEPSLGDDLHVSFSRYCPEKKFARLYADTIADDRMTVMLHANVVEMVPSEDKCRIASLRYRALSGKEGSCTARQIVLCLGGIETARLLLNQDFAPWNESKLVGRYFQDHVHCFAADVRNADLQSPSWPYGPGAVNGKYLAKIKLTAAAQQKYGVLNVGGAIEYADGIHESLRTGIKVLAGPTSAIGLKEFARMTPRVPAVAWHHLRNRRTPGYRLPWAKPKLSVWCEQSPLSESRITLSNKRDKLGLLKANLTWHISDLEIATIRQYVSIVRQAFAERGIADIVPDADLQNDRIYEKLSDQFHHCGGTRMASRSRDGVVDLDLRLNGVKNAFVCSSSVFPCSGIAGPTHTIVALAARLGEHLDTLLARRKTDHEAGAAA